jgi:antitoxin HicB
MNVLYPALFEYEHERYTVKFVDLEEAITEGETLEEALFNACEVLTLTLESRMDEAMEIPMPSKMDDQNIKLIAPLAKTQSALLMRWAKGNHTTAEIARILNTSSSSLARLEDPHYWPNLKDLELAATALGQKLIIFLEPVSRR